MCRTPSRTIHAVRPEACPSPASGLRAPGHTNGARSRAGYWSCSAGRRGLAHRTGSAGRSRDALGRLVLEAGDGDLLRAEDLFAARKRGRSGAVNEYERVARILGERNVASAIGVADVAERRVGADSQDYCHWILLCCAGAVANGV